MATPDTSAQPATTTTTTDESVSVSLLDQAISVTKQTEPSRVEELLRTLTQEATSGTVQYKKNLTVTLKEAIAKIDAQLSEQLATVMHNDRFKALEGSWRGLH